MTALIPIDAEALVVAYLKDVLPTDVLVSTQVSQRARMVKVSLTGGTREGHVFDLPMITIQCWEPSTPAASALCRAVFAHLLDLREHPRFGDMVRAVTAFGAPTHFPDGTAGAERYQTTVQLNLRPTETGEF